MINSIFKKVVVTVIALIVASHVAGQDVSTVTGKVVNSVNAPLRDVAVSFIGSQDAPAITDSTGIFEISVPNGDVWLRISPVGTYETRTIFLNSRTNLTVSLVEKGVASSHDELQIMGTNYKRRDLVPDVFVGTGGAQFENTFATFDQNLQGKVSGLHQTNLSGMPGSGTYMLLRGMNSINTVNQPLVIIDGMLLENPRLIKSTVTGYIYNPLAILDPADISDLLIIKDGSTLTDYGVKGSNGIIFINTLKPVETNTSIDFKYRVGMSLTDHYIPQMEADDYKTYVKEVLASSDIKEEFYSEYYPGLYYTENEEEYLRYSHNTNWQQKVFSNSTVQDAYLSVKGGDAIARYGLSIGFLSHNGIIENTNFNRISTRFVGTFNIFSGLRIFVSANLLSTNSKYKESALGELTSPILSALYKSPQMFTNRYDQDGRLLAALDDIDELGTSNPAAIINNFSAKNANYRFLTSFRIVGDISENIKWNSILGLNINDLQEKVFMPNYGMELYYDKEAYNVSKSLNNLLFSLSNDNFITYNNLFGGIHRLNMKAGARWQTNELQEDLAIAMNSNENDQYTDLGSGDNQLRFVDGDNAQWNWLSNYYSVDYIFRDKYIVDAGLSADFSSRVGKEAENVLMVGKQPFGIFYNIGAAWRVSNESFMGDFSNYGDLKFRVNYGTSGNDDIGNRDAFGYYTLKRFRATSGMIPGGFPNVKLKFETTRQLSTGLDLGIMENRLRLSAAYYSSITSDMLIFNSLPSYLGYDVFPSNDGSMSNNGYELSLNSRLMQSEDFSLDIGLTFAHYKTEIIEIPNGEIITELPGGARIINRIGDEANSFYGFDYLGVFSSMEDVAEASLVNADGVPYRSGDAHYADISGPMGRPDSVINDYDKMVLGSANPEYYGGFSVNMRYKRLSLYMMLQFTYGNENYNYLRYMDERMTGIGNQSTAVLNRWIYEGQDTDVPRSLWDDPIGNSAFSSRWIEDGSYARLKQVTLSYHFDEKVLFFRNLTVFLTGTNLLTFSNYLSYDPEFSYSFDPMMQGIDYGLMPHARTVMAGIKFGL